MNRVSADPQKILFAIHLQMAYQLLCLLHRPVSRIIIKTLSRYPDYSINNTTLVNLINRTGGYHKRLSQSEISVMLSHLKRKGIILIQPQGQHIYYAIDVDRIAEIQGAITRFFDSDK